MAQLNFAALSQLRTDLLYVVDEGPTGFAF